MFPVSREKYNAAIAERDLLQDQLSAAQKELDEANASFAAVTTRASDLSLEVQQLESQLENSQQSEVERLNNLLSEAKITIKNHETDLNTRTNELAQANERILELEQTVATLKNTAVDPPAKAITDNDATQTDHAAIVQFFATHADDTDACIAKLRELGL